jgi:hypothetical protein
MRGRPAWGSQGQGQPQSPAERATDPAAAHAFDVARDQQQPPQQSHLQPQGAQPLPADVVDVQWMHGRGGVAEAGPSGASVPGGRTLARVPSFTKWAIEAVYETEPTAPSDPARLDCLHADYSLPEGLTSSLSGSTCVEQQAAISRQLCGLSCTTSTQGSSCDHRTGVGTSRHNSYNERTVAGTSRQSSCNERTVAGTSRQSSCNERVGLGLPRPSSYDQRIGVGTSYPSSQDHRVGVGVPPPRSYDQRTGVGIPRPSSYDQRVGGGTSHPNWHDPQTGAAVPNVSSFSPMSAPRASGAFWDRVEMTQREFQRASTAASTPQSMSWSPSTMVVTERAQERSLTTRRSLSPSCSPRPRRRLFSRINSRGQPSTVASQVTQSQAESPVRHGTLQTQSSYGAPVDLLSTATYGSAAPGQPSTMLSELRDSRTLSETSTERPWRTVQVCFLNSL